MDPARFFCEWLSTKPACCFPLALAHPLTKTYRDAYLPSPGKFAADFRETAIPKTDSVKYKRKLHTLICCDDD